MTYPYEQYMYVYIYSGANGSIAPECQVETLCIDIYMPGESDRLAQKVRGMMVQDNKYLIWSIKPLSRNMLALQSGKILSV